MCGIYGYIQSTSKKQPLEACIEGLRKLQYRGYDSAGVASIDDGDLISYKTVGKVDLLDFLIKKNHHNLTFGIAHTRWATHGSLEQKNAHPQTDANNSIALVHNGIIENYLELKKFLQDKGIVFQSETDTEVIVNLISYFYSGDLNISIIKALELLKGAFAIALIHKDFPNTIVAAARSCPLVIGICNATNDVYISSDPSSFSNSTYKTYFLQNDEVAKITPLSLDIYNKNGVKISKSPSHIEINNSSDDKNGYAHYMQKEIQEQSLLAREILLRRSFKESFFFEELSSDTETIKQLRSIEIIACGSSYHAGLIAKQYLEMITSIEVSVEYASEYRYNYHLKKEHTLAIFISQSGETADTLAALRYKKNDFLLTIALCNTKNSTLTRECDRFIPLHVGKEISVCSTKAFSGQLINLYLLGIHISNIQKKDNSPYIRELENLSYSIDDILSKENQIKLLAKKYSNFPYFFFIGRGVMYPTCMEAALKLKEISYIPAEAIPAGEMKHGPIALIDSSMATVAFLGNGISGDKTLSNLNEIKARGGNILIFGSQKDSSITDDWIQIPENGSGIFSPIIYSIAGQMFAYYIARELGQEIDLPRNLAKSVTVE